MTYPSSLYPSFCRVPNDVKFSPHAASYFDFILNIPTSLFTIFFALARTGEHVTQWKDLLLHFQNPLNILRGCHDR